MRRKICLLLALFTLNIANGGVAQTLCSSQITRELEICAKANYETSDSHLNSVYRNLHSKLNDKEKGLLTKAQRSWVNYKEDRCNQSDAGDSVGAEAGIEKWVCLDQVTEARVRELEYLDLGAGSQEFFHAADLVARLYENGQRSAFIDKLIANNNFNGINWVSYVNYNCKLVVTRIHEDKKTCLARQNFYH